MDSSLVVKVPLDEVLETVAFLLQISLHVIDTCYVVYDVIMRTSDKKINRKTKWLIGLSGVVTFLALLAVTLILTLSEPTLVFLKPTYLPRSITINNSYMSVDYPSDVRLIVHAAIYETTDPNMIVSAYRSDDGSIWQLDCSQQVQDQTCTRKVTQEGITYFVFDSLNGALQTHSVRVKATINSNVIDISIEPPLTTELNASYDWSRTLDSLTAIRASSLPAHEQHFGG